MDSRSSVLVVHDDASAVFAWQRAGDPAIGPSGVASIQFDEFSGTPSATASGVATQTNDATVLARGPVTLAWVSYAQARLDQAGGNTLWVCRGENVNSCGPSAP